MHQRSRPIAPAARPGPALSGSLPASSAEGSAPGPITSRSLLRRLARLDVLIDTSGDEPAIARSPSGGSAAVRPGWWSQEAVGRLLTELAVSADDFADTR